MLMSMTGSTIDITTPDGTADAYLAKPDSGEARHGVLFLIDAFGLRPVIENMADRIAQRGYAVLAPNVFYRSGRAPLFEMPDLSDPEKRSAFFETLRPLREALTPEAIEADGKAYLDRLNEEVPGRVAITGYCMGARIGWWIAAAHPDRVAGLAVFHAGGMATDGPESPHLAAADVTAEMYFGFADEDPSMTAEQIATLEQALEDAGVPYRAEVYEGARHGYTMADGPAFDEQARERHFRELSALLKRTVG
jgi:carboxymethylenebutenolidase